MFNFDDNDSNLTTVTGKGVLLLLLVFAGLFIWHVTANATPMAHWANVRQSNGDLLGTVYAGEEVTVLGQAEDPYRSYVYVPSLGMYGYICSVYIYGGTEWEYDHPFEYGSGYSSYDYYQSYDYGYDDYIYYQEEESYSYPKEDYVYSYSDDYYSSYDQLYDTYGGYSATWVEVDVTDQTARLWDGRDVLAEDYCVTGMADKSPTPTGYYNIDDKERNKTLRGYDYDGSMYTSFVEYWMPFNGGIGLHDASWRDSFGGDIYKNAGSHGCVNLPPYLAKVIWDETIVGSPVVVHK